MPSDRSPVLLRRYHKLPSFIHIYYQAVLNSRYLKRCLDEVAQELRPSRILFHSGNKVQFIYHALALWLKLTEYLIACIKGLNVTTEGKCIFYCIFMITKQLNIMNTVCINNMENTS